MTTTATTQAFTTAHVAQANCVDLRLRLSFKVLLSDAISKLAIASNLIHIAQTAVTEGAITGSADAEVVDYKINTAAFNEQSMPGQLMQFEVAYETNGGNVEELHERLFSIATAAIENGLVTDGTDVLLEDYSITVSTVDLEPVTH